MTITFCPKCGNTKSNCVCKLTENQNQSNEYQCNYFDKDNVRCKKIGVLSPNIRGNGPWFCCFEHARANGIF